MRLSQRSCTFYFPIVDSVAKKRLHLMSLGPFLAKLTEKWLLITHNSKKITAFFVLQKCQNRVNTSRTGLQKDLSKWLVSDDAGTLN